LTRRVAAALGVGAGALGAEDGGSAKGDDSGGVAAALLFAAEASSSPATTPLEERVTRKTRSETPESCVSEDAAPVFFV